MSSSAYRLAAETRSPPLAVAFSIYSMAKKRSCPVGRVFRSRSAAAFRSSPWRPSSSQTVLSSRAVPSRVTCTRLPLGASEGGKEARETRPAQLPLHLAGEGVVVGDLLLDFGQLVVEAATFVRQALERVEDPPFALPPTFHLPLDADGPGQPPHLPGTIGGTAVPGWVPMCRSRRTRPNSKILFRTPPSSFRRTDRRRSSCRIRSRIRFRRSRHFFCSSKARRTWEESIECDPLQMVQTI